MDIGTASSATQKVDKGALLPTEQSETWMEVIQNFYLIPEGPFMANWDRVMVLATLINCIIVSFMAAFQQITVATFILTYFIDCLFIGDTFVKFHVAYLQGGFWVVFPRDMACNYMASREFKYDIISLLPLDIIAVIWGAGTEDSLHRLSVIRLVKMIRGMRILTYFYKQEKKLHATMLLQICKFVSFLIMLIHNISCIWFSLACPRGNPESCIASSWVTLDDLTPDESYHFTSTLYIYSTYWSVATMATVGYGDIRPENDAERIFAIFVMTCGNFFFGYISGTIASALSNMDSRRVSYQQKMDAVRQYMNDRNMDADMQERVLDYYDYVWERNKGIDVRNLFDDMPSTFKGEVALSLNNAIIDKATIFRKCSNGFRRLIAIHMKLYLFTANEYVIHKGDLGVEMFFITQGRIDVYASEDLKRPTSSLIEGAHFGEFQIILAYRHEYSARAVCNTDIYVLKKEDLDLAFSCYPEDKDLVRQATEDRYKQAQSAKKSRKAKMDTELEEDDSLTNIHAAAQATMSSSTVNKGRRQSLNPLAFFNKENSQSNGTGLNQSNNNQGSIPDLTMAGAAAAAARPSLMHVFQKRRASAMPGNDGENMPRAASGVNASQVMSGSSLKRESKIDVTESRVDGTPKASVVTKFGQTWTSSTGRKGSTDSRGPEADETQKSKADLTRKSATALVPITETLNSSQISVQSRHSVPAVIVSPGSNVTAVQDAQDASQTPPVQAKSGILRRTKSLRGTEQVGVAPPMPSSPSTSHLSKEPGSQVQSAIQNADNPTGSTQSKPSS
ncbi:Kinesin-like protein kif27 [Chytriomyces hyalinus]|nr:Kinesin-like protein kif27 [Chytriomyces hyalinus]